MERKARPGFAKRILPAALLGAGLVGVGSPLGAARADVPWPDSQTAPAIDGHDLEIQKLVDTLRKETIKDSIALLSEDQQYSFAGIARNRAGSADLQTALAARRVVKVLAELKALPAEECQKQVKKIWADAFAANCELAGYVVRTREVAGLPQNKVSMLGKKLALCAAFLYASELGDPAEIPDLITKVDAFEQGLLGRMNKLELLEIDRAFPAAVARNAFLDAGFKANVLLIAAGKASKATETRAMQVAKDAMADEPVVMTPYDARLSTFDFGHVIEGKPADVSKGSWTVTVWSWKGEVNRDEPGQRVYVARLMEVLREWARRPG